MSSPDYDYEPDNEGPGDYADHERQALEAHGILPERKGAESR